MNNMIAPIQPTTNRLSGAPRHEEALREQYGESSDFPVYDNSESGRLYRQVSWWIIRHPVAAVASAVIVGLTLGLVVKRRNG